MCSSPPRLLIFDKAASDLKKTQNAALRDGNDTQYLRLFKSSIYWTFICTSMTSLCLFIFFFLFAQIIDNNFTVSTSAVMSIYRRGGKVKGGTRWSFYHRVATVWPTQTAHFATGVDEMEKHCGERERERPHVHFRSQVVCLYVHVISNRKVLAGVVEDDQWRFSHNPLCLFLVLQFTERQRAKGSQRE